MSTPDDIERLLGRLPATSLPIALLPVQVQTRYVTRGDAAELLVRVYPDELHVHAHDPRLSAAEVRWGKKAWQLAWPASAPEAERMAWSGLAERFGARRAEWIARALRPTNLPQRPATPPVFPAPGPLRPADEHPPTRARHLPGRWIVAAYVGGERVLLEAGPPIPAVLPVGPTFDDAPPPPPGPGGLALDEGMTWLVDFAAAEKVGMGVRIALTAELAAATLDTVLVFGLNTALRPAEASAALESLLEGQRFTRGLAFVPPGTPTNNTAESSTAYRRHDRGAAPSFESVPATARTGSAAALTARLLGVRPSALAGLEGATSTEGPHARHVQTALWPLTGGYYLDQVMGAPEGQPSTFSTAEVGVARRHFIDVVRALGPLPTVRAGRQPYGLLPVTSLDLVDAAAAGDDRFVGTLRFLREAWRAALPGVPRLAAGGQNPGALVEVLRMHPSSVAYAGRLAFDSEFFAPTTVFSTSLGPELEGHAAAIKSRLQPAVAQELVGEERFFELIPSDVSRPLAAPLVTRGDEGADEPLTANYIRFLRTASFDDILNERLPAGFPPREQVDTLLYLFLRHSVLLAYATVARRILVRRGVLPERFREPTLVDVEGPQAPTPTETLLRAVLTDGTLGSTVHTLGKAQEPEAAELDELRASLRHLETMSVGALERHLRGCIDLWAYRLDAWITSLATRRLNQLRAQEPRASALGAFGWVHDLRPSPRSPTAAPAGESATRLTTAREPGGFIHAPSMAQASAAAVLRSGYLAHVGESGSDALAVDLSSARVRLAESLLDGVRQGQPLGALLGARWERSLHEHGLDRWIADFRRLSLLAEAYEAEARLHAVTQSPIGNPNPEVVKALMEALEARLAPVRARLGAAPTATIAELEPVAAASLTDGLALVRLLHRRGIPTGRLPPLGDDQVALEAELAGLDAAVDALADALTAEGVFQLVRGNPARAAASVDAVAHGEIQPPELHVAETPRPGTALTHRLVALFGAPASPADPPPAGVRQGRRAAEPRLDAWLAQMIGEPRRVRLRAELVDGAGTVLATLDPVRLDLLGLSNLDALHLSASAAPELPSDLERLLEHELLRRAPTTIPPGAGVRLERGRAAGFDEADLSLVEFLELNAAFRQAALGARALDARDFHETGGAVPSAVDADELGARAEAAVRLLEGARDALDVRIAGVTEAAEADLPVALDALRDGLVDLVFLGVPEAVPVSARGSDAAARDALLAQAGTVGREAARRLGEAQALSAGFDAQVATADARVRHEQDRLEAVFGRGFRALPLVGLPDAAALATALGRSDQLLAGNPLDAVSWLHAVSRVRPGASRLSGALTYAAALRHPSALALRVAQLPSEAGERWVGLAALDGRPPALPPGKLSLVAHLPQPFDPAHPLAGLVFDEWVEIVPAAEVTTGVSFHYDAPGARPPQTVLLAVAPPDRERWGVETLEQILLETLELARLRAVDPQSVSDDPLLHRALPALYVTANLAGETLSTDFGRVVG